MTRPRLFVEPFCGSAAVTLRLLGGPRVNPPIAYMGGKRGYAQTILATMGLRQGLGADAVWLNDVGPWAKVWAVLATPGAAAEVARIIRGWSDEEPRALWDRLKAQGWGELERVEEVAAWSTVAGWAHQAGNPSSGFGTQPEGRQDTRVGIDALADRNEAASRWLYLAGRSYRAGDIESGRPDDPDWYTDGRCATATATATATAGDILSGAAARFLVVQGESVEKRGGPASIFQRPNGDLQVDIGSIAGAAGAALGEAGRSAAAAWLTTGAWCYRQADHASGGPVLPGERRQDTTATATATAGAGVPLGASPCRVTFRSAIEMHPPDDCEGVFAYLDPPYRGTTGYPAGTLSREDVVTLARRWSDAGAVVCISEAEPVECGAGWEHVEITGGRVGQKRTFSNQQREWLTINRTPAHRVAVQHSLFGATP